MGAHLNRLMGPVPPVPPVSREEDGLSLAGLERSLISPAPVDGSPRGPLQHSPDLSYRSSSCYPGHDVDVGQSVDPPLSCSRSSHLVVEIRVGSHASDVSRPFARPTFVILEDSLRDSLQAPLT